MNRAFVDASVLYSAIVSASGGSREILKRHLKREIQMLVSEYVLDEVSNNLKSKSPEMAGTVSVLVDLLAFQIVQIDANAIRAAADYTELKDAPVVAAARSGQCDYLLTFDRKHLLNQPEIAKQSGLKIITPGDLLQILRVK